MCPFACSMMMAMIVIVIMRRRLKNNIKMYLREIEFGNMDWIHLAEDRDQLRALVSAVMNLPIP
jgi:hypothetical protein